jgi:hypothetical protein
LFGVLRDDGERLTYFPSRLHAGRETVAALSIPTAAGRRFGACDNPKKPA